MEHYFFKLVECGVVTVDPDGRDMADLSAARHAALVDAREIMCGELKEGRLCLSCRIEISSVDGTCVETVRFKDAVTISGFQ